MLIKRSLLMIDRLPAAPHHSEVVSPKRQPLAAASGRAGERRAIRIYRGRTTSNQETFVNAQTQKG